METFIIAQSATSPTNIAAQAASLVASYASLVALMAKPAPTVVDIETIASLNVTLNAVNITYDPGVTSLDIDVVTYGLETLYLQVTPTTDAAGDVTFNLVHSGLHVNYNVDCGALLKLSGCAADVVYVVLKNNIVSYVLQSQLVKTYKSLAQPTLANSYEDLLVDQTLLATIAISSTAVGLQTYHPVLVSDALLPTVSGANYSGLTSSAILASFIPTVNTAVQLANAKYSLIDQLSIYDSLSALEKQVDLISSLVIGLMTSTNAIVPTWYASYLSEVESESTMATRKPDALITTINKIKTELRTVQAAYKSQVTTIEGL